MDKNVQSFKVVNCPYFPMSSKDETCKKTIGLFVVIYNEEEDVNCVVPQNVIALKITTSKPYTSLYHKFSSKTVLTYEGKQSYFSFNKECYVLGTHFITLPTKDCVVVGELSLKDSAAIARIISDSFNKISKQCVDMMSCK